MNRCRLLLCLLRLNLRLAVSAWRIRRLSAALERAEGLPPGWLLIEGNAERYRAWSATRARWRAAMSGGARYEPR